VPITQVIGIPVAWLADRQIKRKSWPTIAVRRLVNAFALGGQMTALLAISFLPTILVHAAAPTAGDSSGSGSLAAAAAAAGVFDGSGSSLSGGGGETETARRQMSGLVVRISVVLLGVAVGCGACLGSAAIANVYDIAPTTAGHVTSVYNCL
jgi:hypothetical protein